MTEPISVTALNQYIKGLLDGSTAVPGIGPQ